MHVCLARMPKGEGTPREGGGEGGDKVQPGSTNKRSIIAPLIDAEMSQGRCTCMNWLNCPGQVR